MQLPELLQEKIDQWVENTSLRNLYKEAQTLSLTYRKGEGKKVSRLASDGQRLSYVLMRMPATYAVVRRVFEELFHRDPLLHLENILDVGAGPGTCWWAMRDWATPQQKWTFWERDPGFVHLAKSLCGSEGIRFIESDVAMGEEGGVYDLVIASFSLAEMDEKDREKVVLSMWKATQKTLVIIEPGTPSSFERMRKIREQLIAEGAHLIAPCPTPGRCPMQGGDWCHFGTRVERSSFHRQLKGGFLNYEDEKFTYLIFSRKKTASAKMRILSHPEKKSGHMRLKLCVSYDEYTQKDSSACLCIHHNQVVEKVISRSSKEVYRQAKKKKWGDEL